MAMYDSPLSVLGMMEEMSRKPLSRRLSKLIEGTATEKFRRVGWIDDDLEVNSKGSNFLEEFLFEKFSKELEKEADKLIAEMEGEE